MKFGMGQDGIEVRVLDDTDFVSVVDLNRRHSKVMRHAKPGGYNSEFETSLVAGYLHKFDSHRVMLGAFQHNRLDCVISLFFWRTFPYYSISNLKMRSGATHLLSSRNNVLSACISGLLKLTEHRGFLRGYLIRSEDHWPADRIARRLQQTCAELTRYERLFELLVEKGTRPSYPFVWEMMGSRIWDHDLVLESISLRQEHRAVLGPGNRIAR
jgi:hypothetical protein